MSTKRVLITGAGGFVGPNLIRELQAQDYSDIYASVYSASSDLSKLLPLDRVLEGDLTRYDDAEKLVKTSQPDLIFHLASLSVVENSVQEATRVLTSNTLLQYNLLEAVKRHAVKSRLITICSANEYGLVRAEEVPIKETQPLRPLNPYAVSKVTQEMLSLQYHFSYGMDIVILRAFNHTGPGQTEHFVIPALAKQFIEIERGIKEPVIEVGNLGTARDFTDVVDIAKAYILASVKCHSGEIYNIGSGKAVTIQRVVDELQKQTQLKVELKSKSDMVRPADVPILLADNSKFTAITGWKPAIPFEETLANVLEYYRTKLGVPAL